MKFVQKFIHRRVKQKIWFEYKLQSWFVWFGYWVEVKTSSPVSIHKKKKKKKRKKGKQNFKNASIPHGYPFKKKKKKMQVSPAPGNKVQHSYFFNQVFLKNHALNYPIWNPHPLCGQIWNSNQNQLWQSFQIQTFFKKSMLQIQAKSIRRRRSLWMKFQLELDREEIHFVESNRNSNWHPKFQQYFRWNFKLNGQFFPADFKFSSTEISASISTGWRGEREGKGRGGGFQMEQPIFCPLLEELKKWILMLMLMYKEKVEGKGTHYLPMKNWVKIKG